MLDAVGFGHERLRRVRVREPYGVAPRDRERAGRVAVLDVGEELVVERREQRCEQRGRREERSGRGDVARFEQEQRQVGRRAAAQRGVRPQVFPQRVGGRRVVDVRAHHLRWALLREEAAGRVTQQLLVVGEREVHDACLTA